MVRIAPEDADTLLQRDHVQPMVMGGREMRGWVRVSGPGVGDMRKLRGWVDRGVAFARSLPAK